MVRELQNASLCIADLTGANPNVMWEFGFATALNKPTIALCQSELKLPFDVKDVRTIQYDRGSLSGTLRTRLQAAIQATLERYAMTSTLVKRHEALDRTRSIAITGSSAAIPKGARDRVSRLLKPYLGRGYLWYVGSSGVVDEVATNFLAESGEEQITVVGYTSYDISGPLLKIIESVPNVEFTDASREQVPLIPGAPSHRDILFAARADLIVLMWNGISDGTRELMNWIGAQGKDHLLGFVPPPYRESAGQLVR
jgi:hypothetical protein